MKLTSWVILLLLSASLMACNTVEGFGKDLSKLGEKIEKSVDDNK